jgi:drug/metabolite transporter (DMT)-like permease
MSLAVLSLVLAAAFAHAGWNFLAKGAGGGAAFVWLAALAGTVIYLPVVAIVHASTSGQFRLEALGLMAGSGVLHSVYFVLLQRGYATGDLSLVYPLARGTGPLLSGAAAIAFLGERPSALALAGALTIVAAVLSFVVRPGDSLRHGARAAIVFALLTGVAIASYTLWDKHAVGPAHLSPVVYNWGSQVVVVLILTPHVLRGGPRARGVVGVAGPRDRRRGAEPARLRARALRARPGARERGRPGARDEHPHRHPARNDGAGRRRHAPPHDHRRRDPPRRDDARARLDA